MTDKAWKNAERWVPVSGFEGMYEISDRGNVRSVDRLDTIGRRRSGRLMSLSPGTTGRCVVELRGGGRSYHRAVSEIARESFVGVPLARKTFVKGARRGGSYVRCNLYAKWISMRNRCNNPNTPDFHLWGGKGVRVCSAWASYDAFRGWAIGAGFKKGLSLDRIDGNGDYEPENCRWVSMTVQGRNKVIQPVGENNGRAKLTDDDVRAIRRSEKSHSALHRKFGVSVTNIAKIRRGELWSHVR